MAIDPDPAGPEVVVISRSPNVGIVAWPPDARNIAAVVVRRGRRRARFERGGRWFQIVNLWLVAVGPESRRPLPALVSVRPVARHPSAIGRLMSPKPADPDPVLAFAIPRPIT